MKEGFLIAISNELLRTLGEMGLKEGHYQERRAVSLSAGEFL
jgi:hypothetical protein